MTSLAVNGSLLARSVQLSLKALLTITTHIDTLIPAPLFYGFTPTGQLSINTTIGELVPICHRFAANNLIFLFTLPTTTLNPYIARLFIV